MSASVTMCRPSFVEPSDPVLEIIDGQHPLVSCEGNEFIPNDCCIEGEAHCLVITGPNMGGKSTFMRQTGLLVVLAQLVCTFLCDFAKHITFCCISGLLCAFNKV